MAWDVSIFQINPNSFVLPDKIWMEHRICFNWLKHNIKLLITRFKIK